MKGRLLVITKSNWQHFLKVLNGKVSNAGNRAVKESNLSPRKRRLPSCQAAEVGNSVGYTAEGIPGISNISLKGKFSSWMHRQPRLPSADHSQRRLKAANTFPM